MIHKIRGLVKRYATRDRMTRPARKVNPKRQKIQQSRSILWTANGSLRVLEVA